MPEPEKAWRRVLLVDDSSTMRLIVRKVLAASKYAMQIAEAADGPAALAELDARSFDLVFLDYNLPGLNGLETAALIKRRKPDLRVVLISSAQDPALPDAALRDGVEFLKKPFYPADIDRLIESQVISI